MGMFNSFAAYSGLDESGNFFNETELEEAMQELEEVEDVEVNDDLMEACVQAAIANEQNLNMVIMSVANEEMNYFVENGVEMVYEEGKISAFFGRIKSMLKKAWEKIKSIFNKALDHVRQWIISDKKFVSKYSAEIKKYADKVTIEGYQYTNQRTEEVYTSVAMSVSDLVYSHEDGDAKMKKSETSDKLLGAMRAKAVKSSNKTLSTDEFSTELKKLFGMDQKKSDLKYPGNVVLDELKLGKSTERSIKNGYDSAKKAIAVLEKDVKTAEKNANEIARNSGKDAKTGSYSVLLSVCSGAIAMLNAAQRIQISAVSGFHTNCRKIAAKCVSKSKGSTNESFNFDDFDALLV